VETLAGIIRLKEYSTFSLFTSRKTLLSKASAAAKEGEGTEESVIIQDGVLVSDILSDFRESKSDPSLQCRIVFKKRMFRDTDEAITEPMFVNLSYLQAKHDFLGGNYPVGNDDSMQLAAFQIQAEEGNAMRDVDELANALGRFLPRAVLSNAPREELAAVVMSRHKLLLNHSKDDARLGLLTMIRALPYGGSIFFPVKRIEDPIGLLPGRIVLGINKRGIHFFRPVPMEYLHSAELRDIMQFGSSAAAVFFKMRVAGVLHIFQFDTKQGEDICIALQTHINDVMTKRYAEKKQKNAAHSFGGSDGTKKVPAAAMHATAASSSLKKASDKAFGGGKGGGSSEETNKKIDELILERADLAYQLKQAKEQVQAMQDRADADAAELAALKSAGAAGAGAKAAGKADAGRVKELEKEKKLLEQKLTRMEASAKEDAAKSAASASKETQDLRKKYEAAEIAARASAESLEEANRALDAMRAEYDAVAGDLQELETLRELKADVERKEKQAAAIMKNQTAKIAELEQKYQEESTLRKRYFNQMEDMKGKIRVYARTRPLTGKETKEKQNVALQIPDEFTVEHPWKDERKNRSYTFDTVFGAETPQEQVFEDTKYLVQSAFDGYNVCIFAYGQTGSGKTFTIYGDDKNPGLTPRAISEVMKIVYKGAKKNKFTVKMEAYMLELYQDSVNDLLLGPDKQKNPPKLDIKKDAKGWVTVQNATTVPVSSEDDIKHVITSGLNVRKVSSTKMNVESSRSHLIFSLVIETTDLQTQAVTRGKLSFVDLAGSERTKKSGAAGEQMKEAQAINKSLSALGNVISALASESGHIPYRDHKLTMLMSDSLGGNAKTLMFVNVSPTDDNLEETQNSLTYATRVRTIKNDTSKDVVNKEMARLKAALAAARAKSGDGPETQDIANARQGELK